MIIFLVLCVFYFYFFICLRSVAGVSGLYILYFPFDYYTKIIFLKIAFCQIRYVIFHRNNIICLIQYQYHTSYIRRNPTTETDNILAEYLKSTTKQNWVSFHSQQLYTKCVDPACVCNVVFVRLPLYLSQVS